MYKSATLEFTGKEEIASFFFSFKVTRDTERFMDR